MPEQTITKDHPYKVDGYLRNARGAIATILEVVEREKPYRFKGLRTVITEPDGHEHRAFLLPNVLPAWPVTDEAPKKPAPVETMVEVDDDGKAVSDDEAAALDGIQRDFERQEYERIEREETEEATAPVVFADQAALREAIGLPPAQHTMPKLTQFFKDEAARQDAAMADETADQGSILADNPIIQQLQQNLDSAHALAAEYLVRIKELETEREALIESRDSAIDHDAAAADRRAEVAEATADARPCKKFEIVLSATAAHLERMERDHWEVEHMQWVVEADTIPQLNVVYSRYTPAPAAPETTRRAAVAVPGTHFVMPTSEHIVSETPVALHERSVEARKAHYSAIITNRSLSPEEKTKLLNQSLVELGTATFERVTNAPHQPVQSLMEYVKND